MLNQNTANHELMARRLSAITLQQWNSVLEWVGKLTELLEGNREPLLNDLKAFISEIDKPVVLSHDQLFRLREIQRQLVPNPSLSDKRSIIGGDFDPLDNLSKGTEELSSIHGVDEYRRANASDVYLALILDHLELKMGRPRSIWAERATFRYDPNHINEETGFN